MRKKKNVIIRVVIIVCKYKVIRPRVRQPEGES